jgi:hypothetical protein
LRFAIPSEIVNSPIMVKEFSTASQNKWPNSAGRASIRWGGNEAAMNCRRQTRG